MVLQFLLRLPVGSCSPEAVDFVELSFSSLRRLPPLFRYPGCETDDGSVRFLICYIFG